MKQQRKLWWVVWIALAWGLVLSTPSKAAVGLEYFRAENATTQIRLTWKTGYEDSIIGFRVRRSDQPLVPLSVIYNNAPTTLIITSPENAFGATYIVYDPSAVNGQTYTYKLYELLSNNTESAPLESATVTVQITGGGGGLPTNTPTTASTTAPTATTGATTTPAPTTSGATSTPTPTTAATTAVTNTPTATTAATTAASAPTATARPVATTSSGTSGGNTGTESSTGSTNAGNTGDTTTQNQTPTATPTTSSGVPVAEAGTLPETNQEEGESYPAPNTNETGAEERPIETTTGNEGTEPTAYPVESTPATNPITTPSAEGYVPPAVGNGVPTIPSIGSGQTSPNTPLLITPSPTAAAGDSSNTLLLWGGFILALFVFLTGVISSILILRHRS